MNAMAEAGGPVKPDEGRVDRFPVATVASIALAAAIVALLLSGVWIGIFADAGASGPEGTAPPADPARERPGTLESAWPKAEARAKTWDTDARLFSAAMQYDWSRDPGAAPALPAGGWLTYVFVRGDGSETDALTIVVERNGAVIAREVATDLGVDHAARDDVAFTGVAVDSRDALQAAEAAGGGLFRSECRATRYVTRQTFHPGSGVAAPVWVLTYNDNRVRNGPALRIDVDATSGEAVVTPFGGSDPPLDELGACPDR